MTNKEYFRLENKKYAKHSDKPKLVIFTNERSPLEKVIHIKGVARYFLQLRKNGLTRHEAICKIEEGYKRKGRKFFSSEVSWWKMFFSEEDRKYF